MNKNENLQNYITGYGFDGDIDILSLDMDGIDYWIMRSLKEYLMILSNTLLSI